MRISSRKISVLLFLILLLALLIRIMVLQSEDEESIYRKVFERWEETVVCRSLPLLSFYQEEHPQDQAQLAHQLLAQAFPWYAYEKLYLTQIKEERMTDELGDAGVDEKNEPSEDEPLPDDKTNPGEQLSHEIQTGNQMEQKNLDFRQEEIEIKEKAYSGSFEKRLQEAMEDPWAIYTAQLQSRELFSQALIDNAHWDFNYLIHNWYTVDTSTDAAAINFSADQMVAFPAGIKKDDNGGYDILIYHTHALEQFQDSSQYPEPNGVQGAGEFLATLLEEQYGYRVLHLTQSFDAEGRDYAYGKALPALEEVLSQHPEIQVMIDLHRDEVDSNAHLVQQIDGKGVARYMFFNGLSYTRTLGALEGFPNPWQKENLAVSYQLQLASDALFPGAARKIYLKGYRYNMHLRPRSILIELGAQNNTEQEAWNSSVLLAKILDTVLSYGIR